MCVVQENLSANLFEKGLREILPYKEEVFINALTQCAMKTAKEEETNSINIIKLLDKVR